MQDDLLNLVKELSTRAYDIAERMREAGSVNEKRERALKEKVEGLNESGLASRLTLELTG